MPLSNCLLSSSVYPLNDHKLLVCPGSSITGFSLRDLEWSLAVKI